MNQACLKSELSIFDPPLTQVTMERALWKQVLPSHSLDGDGAIELLLAGTQNEYLDLNDTVLYVKMKVTKKDGTDLAAGAHATPANLVLSSLFSDITLSLADQVIEGGHNMYPYKAMMTSLLQYDASMKATQLEAAGFHETAAIRKGWIAGSASYEFIGPLHLDMFCQSKYLIPGVKVRLTLTRSSINFSMMNNAVKDDLKVKFENVSLYVRKVTVNPAVLSAHQDGLEKVGNAIYPIQQCEMINFSIAAGASSHMTNQLLTGQTPKFVVVGLVKSETFNGDAKDDPLYFKSFNLNYIALQRDGENVPYTHALQPDFTNGLVAQSYMAMIQNLEIFNKNVSNGITLEKYKNGSTLFVFNLTPDLSAGGSCGQPYQTGDIKLELKFGTPLTSAINVIVMAIRDGRIEINKYRQVMKS